jgi:Asp/Glu/hydantoin racemase
MQDQTEVQVIATGEASCAGLANGLAYYYGIPILDLNRR